GFSLYKGLKQANQIIGDPGYDIDHQDNRYTITHTVLSNPLTNPHQHTGACGQASYYHNTFYHCHIRNQPSVSEAYSHSNRLEKSQTYCNITGNCCKFLPSLFTIPMHFL